MMSGVSLQKAVFTLCILLLCFLISFCTADSITNDTQNTVLPGDETFQIKQILIIESRSHAESYGQGIRGGIQSVFDPIPTIRYTTESLHTDSFRNITNNHIYLKLFSDFLSTRYRDTTFDAIIVIDGDALGFIQKYRDTLFPDIPIISTSISTPYPYELRWRDISFVQSSSIEKTLGLMMTQYPEAKSLYALLPSSQAGINAQIVINEFIDTHPDWIDAYYAAPLYMTSDDLLEEMRSIPDLDIVFLQGYDFSDEFGRFYPILQVLPEFTSEIDAPFYVMSDTYNENGILGGFEVKLTELGVSLGNAALDIVHNTEGKDIPAELRIHDIEPIAVFSYETLERFGIPHSSLPSHAVIIGGPKTTVPISPEILYGVSALLIVLLSTACVLGYGEMQIKRANTAVMKEKNLIAKLIANIPIGICVLDAQDQRKHVLFNNKLGELLGIEPEEVLGTSFPIEPLRIDEYRGESLSARCMRTRSLIESELVYITPHGHRTLYALCYPTFDENDDVHQIVVHYVDRTEERAWERELERNLMLFQSFFEQNIVAIGLYEPVYENGCVNSFIFIDINDEFERLTGVSRDTISNLRVKWDAAYFALWHQVLKDKKPLHFQNWHSSKKDKYLSGYVFPFGASREYLCVTALDTTHIVRSHKNEQLLLEQIETNFQKLSALSTEMRQPLHEMLTLLANEESSLHLGIITEQLHIIIKCIDRLEKGFIESEKMQMYLKKYNNIVIDLSEKEIFHDR